MKEGVPAFDKMVEEVSQQLQRLHSTLALSQEALVEIREIPGGYIASIPTLDIIDEHLHVSNKEQATQILEDRLNSIIREQAKQVVKAIGQLMQHPHYKLLPEADRREYREYEDALREFINNKNKSFVKLGTQPPNY